MKIELEATVRQSLRWWSVRLAALWAVLVGVITVDPSVIATTWNLLPAELRPEIPQWLRGAITGLLMFGTIWTARLIKQKPRD